MTCFFQAGSAVHLYERMRDRPEDNSHIEAMWRAFAPFCGDPIDSFLATALWDLGE
jgi:hypothetical protein